MASSTTGTISIQVSQQGAQQVQRSIEDIGRGADAAASSVKLLQGILATLGIGTGLSQIIEQLNLFQELQNRIKVVTSDVGTQSAAWAELVAAATQVRAPLENLTLLYQRLALAGKDLTASGQEMIDVAKNINAAMLISGTGAIEARGAIIQLSQSLASGAMDSREWLSVSHEIPVLARAIARGLREMASDPAGITQLRKTMTELDVEMLKLPGTLGVIRSLVGAHGGAMISDTLFEALKRGAKDFAAQAEALPKTISQAFQVLRTQLLNYVGALDQGIGGSQRLASAIIYLATHLATVEKGVTAVGIALALYFGPQILLGIVRNLAAATAAMLVFAATNPFLALGLALSAVIGYIVAFERESRAANVAVGLFHQGIELLKAGFGGLSDAYKGVTGVSIAEGFTQGLSNARAALSAFIPLVAGIFGGLGAIISKTFDDIGLPLTTMLENLKRGVAAILGALADGIAFVNRQIDALYGKLPSALRPSTPAAPGAAPTTLDVFKGGFSPTYESARKGVEEVNRILDGIVTNAERVGRAAGAAIGSGLTETIGGLTITSTGGALQGPTPSGKTLDAAVGSNAAQIAQALKDVGANETAIAGFLANFQKESGFRPTDVNKDSGASNFAQWLGPRLDALKALGNPTELATGIALMKRELLGPYSGVLAAANAAGSRGDAAEIVARRYEVPFKPGPRMEAEVAARRDLAEGGAFTSSATSPLSTVNQPPDTITRQSAAELQKIQQMDVTIKAQLELDQGTRALNEARKAMPEQAARWSAMEEILKTKLQDQLEPLKAQLRPLQESVKYMDEMNPATRKAAEATDKMVEALKKQGQVLSTEAVAKLKETVTELEHLKAVSTEMDSIWKGSSAGALDTFNTKVEALNRLLADGKIRVDEYNDAWGKAKADVLEKSDSMFDGIQAGLLRVSTGFGTEAKIWSDAVQAVFTTTEGFIENMVKTGQGKFSDLIKSITADLAKAAFRGAMKEAFGGLFGGGEGGSKSGGGGLLASLFGKGTGTDRGGSGFGTGVSGGGSASNAIGSALGGLLGPGEKALGGGKGLMGWLFGGGGPSSEGDYWLSYAQGLKDEGKDVKQGLLDAGVDKQAFKDSYSYWMNGEGFAYGGQFHVPGQGGTDTVPVQFMATPGERVTIETPLQQAASRLNGFNPNVGRYAEGGDFQVAGGPASNFTVPPGVPDWFANEGGPFLYPGAANQPPGPSINIPPSQWRTGVAPEAPAPSEAYQRLIEQAAPAGSSAEAATTRDVASRAGKAADGDLRVKLPGGYGWSLRALRSRLGFEEGGQFFPDTEAWSAPDYGTTLIPGGFGTSMPWLGYNRETGDLTGRLPGIASIVAPGLLPSVAPLGALTAGARIPAGVNPRLLEQTARIKADITLENAARAVPDSPLPAGAAEQAIIDSALATERAAIAAERLQPGPRDPVRFGAGDLRIPMANYASQNLGLSRLTGTGLRRDILSIGGERVDPASRLLGDPIFLPSGRFDPGITMPRMPRGIAAGEAELGGGFSRADAILETELAIPPMPRAPAAPGRSIRTEYEDTGLFGLGTTTRTVIGDTAAQTAARAAAASPAVAAAARQGFGVGGALMGTARFAGRHPLLTSAGVAGGLIGLGGLVGPNGEPVVGGPAASPGGAGGLPPGVPPVTSTPGGTGGIVPHPTSTHAIAAAAAGAAGAAPGTPAPLGSPDDMSKWVKDYSTGLSQKVGKGEMSAADAAKDLSRVTGGAIPEAVAKDMVKQSKLTEVVKGKNDKEKGKGLGTWGWIGLGAAAIGLAGALIWYLTRKTKKDPLVGSAEWNAKYNTASWPNRVGAWPTGYATGGSFTVPGFAEGGDFFADDLSVGAGEYGVGQDYFGNGGSVPSYGIDPTLANFGADRDRFGNPTDVLQNMVSVGRQQSLSPEEAQRELYGMTGIPLLTDAYGSYQRGEYLNAIGQGAAGAAQLGSLAIPVGRAAVAGGEMAARAAPLAGRAIGAVLGDSSGSVTAGNAIGLRLAEASGLWRKYDILGAEGAPVGKATIKMPGPGDGTEAYVANIVALDSAGRFTPLGSPNALGPSAVRGILRQFSAENPSITGFRGNRVSGARSGGVYGGEGGGDVSVSFGQRIGQLMGDESGAVSVNAALGGVPGLLSKGLGLLRPRGPWYHGTDADPFSKWNPEITEAWLTNNPMAALDFGGNLARVDLARGRVFKDVASATGGRGGPLLVPDIADRTPYVTPEGIRVEPGPRNWNDFLFGDNGEFAALRAQGYSYADFLHWGMERVDKDFTARLAVNPAAAIRRLNWIDPALVRAFEETGKMPPGFAEGGEFGVSDLQPFGGAEDSDATPLGNEHYFAPRGEHLPMAAALAQRGALTEQQPVGLKPRSFLETIGGFAGQFGSFISKGLFGSDTSSLFGGGSGGLLGGMFADGGTILVPMDRLKGFAAGGEFDVGGYGGTDSELVAFKATPGEHVEINPPVNVQGGFGTGQTAAGNSTVHNWNITTPDVEGFHRSTGQIATRMGLMAERATRRNA